MADYGLLGDISSTELPEKPVDEEVVGELRRKAKYSRSKEFAELKAHMEQRIDFYQKYLPNGQPVAALSSEDAGKYYVVANIVIAELKQVIDGYESANEQVKEIG